MRFFRKLLRNTGRKSRVLASFGGLLSGGEDEDQREKAGEEKSRGREQHREPALPECVENPGLVEEHHLQHHVAIGKWVALQRDDRRRRKYQRGPVHLAAAMRSGSWCGSRCKIWCGFWCKI